MIADCELVTAPRQLMVRAATGARAFAFSKAAG